MFSYSVTFFAVPDWDFPKPRRRPHQHPGDFDFDWEFNRNNDITDVLAAAEGLLNDNYKPNEDVLHKFLDAIMLYGILPARLSASDLEKNVTFPTSFTFPDGSFDGHPQRIRVNKQAFLPLTINLFAMVTRGDLSAANGESHTASV